MVRIFTRWCCVGVTVYVAGVPLASAQLAPRPALQARLQTAAAAQGELHGSVLDDRGQPLAGAVVSALGATSAFAVSDREGRFVFRDLPAGPFLVRAHLQGYVPERGRILAVNAGARTPTSIVLTRTGDSESPAVLAAGVGASEVDVPEPEAPARHDHDEVAWRLRHLKRSVLKEQALGLADVIHDDSLLGNSLAGLGRAVGTPARLASALFTDIPPLNAQINLLTTTSFDRPQDLFSVNAGAPRGVAYVALAAPTGNGEWAMRGTVTQGDLSSWIVAGSYTRSLRAAHQYEAGFSYGMQRYLGGNAEALAAMRDGSRNVGAMYAYDNWIISPRLSVGYGAKYASYDYLADRDLVSPRASVEVKPFRTDPLKVRASVSHRETAPGAEEFIPPVVGLWLPPERTFSTLSASGFVPERLDHIEVAVEREWAGDVIIGVRAFRQRVDDQGVTVFGPALDDTGAPAPIGHYRVASAGDVEGRGWGVSASRAVGNGVSASVDYTQLEATWVRPSPDDEALARIAGSALRANERVHDVTAAVHSVIAATATRIRVVYKVNSAYSSAGRGAEPGLAGRFDVQVNQSLPFLNFTSGDWEMLVAVRNLFREALLDGSMYDELLVVRPPKRILGGVTVKF